MGAARLAAAMVAAIVITSMISLAGGCLLRGGDDGGSGDCTYMGRVYRSGDVFPAGDGCNSCSCQGGSVACTEIACQPDAGVGDGGSVPACAPSGGCPSGPACNGLCCGSGERCEGGACRCGQNAACGAGDECAAAGPIGGDACGAICCGSSGPCPQ